MRCPQCKFEKMVGIDDAMTESGIGFEEYACPVCLTTKVIQTNGDKLVKEETTYRYDYVPREYGTMREDIRINERKEAKQ